MDEEMVMMINFGLLASISWRQPTCFEKILWLHVLWEKTGDLEEWEDLISAITHLFFEKRSSARIDDNQFSTRATAGAFETQTNLKKVRSESPAIAVCTSNLQYIAGIYITHREENATVLMFGCLIKS